MPRRCSSHKRKRAARRSARSVTGGRKKKGGMRYDSVRALDQIARRLGEEKVRREREAIRRQVIYDIPFEPGKDGLYRVPVSLTRE